MFHRIGVRTLLPILLAGQLVGCGDKPPAPGPKREPTFPVTGQVLVDGQPTPMIKIEAKPINGTKPVDNLSSGAYTDNDGKFVMGTYEGADGVPAGEYGLTFMWGQMQIMKKNAYGGADKFKGKYKDPETSQYKLKIEPGSKGTELKIELTSDEKK